ncbi:MAG: rod shape-determining protein MreC [Gemmatimonadota bacterium]
MEHGPPPLFNQGVSARARLAFFSFLAIALIIVDSRVKALDTIRVGVGVVLYPIQQVLLAPVRATEAVGEYFTTIGRLTRENEALKRGAVERASELQQAKSLEVENAQLRRLLGAREKVNRPGVLAQVLYESRDRFARKLVLDKGSRDGVRAGQPVIDDRGVLGQITRVFPLTAEMTLITDKEQSIPVQIARNGLRGVAYGGADPGTLDLRFMPANADVKQGDVVMTSGIDAIYPAGLQVATVTRVERAERDQFARIVMTPAAGVQSFTYMLVLQVDPAPPPRPAEDNAPEPRKGARK